VKRRHGYVGLIRDSDSGFAYWVGICSCGYRTQAGHLKRSSAAGALVEHIFVARLAERIPVSS